MRFTNLLRVLLGDRWRPYFMGCLVGIHISVAMLQVWKNWDYFA